MNRPIRGTLKFEAEPGTILGPTDITREYLIVLDCFDGMSTLGYATQLEIEAVMFKEPTSVAEHLIQLAKRPGRHGLIRA